MATFASLFCPSCRNHINRVWSSLLMYGSLGIFLIFSIWENYYFDTHFTFGTLIRGMTSGALFKYSPACVCRLRPTSDVHLINFQLFLVYSWISFPVPSRHSWEDSNPRDLHLGFASGEVIKNYQPITEVSQNIKLITSLTTPNSSHT